MKKMIMANSLFYILSMLFIVLGGIYLLASSKESAIFFFSENRIPILNRFFSGITRLGEGPVYVFLGLFTLAIRIRYSILITVTGISVLLLSFGLKQFFAIDRPMSFFTQQGIIDQLNLIQGIELHTGATSFPSGHSMSGFALFTMIALLSKKKWTAVFCFSLAFLIAISRVYLVQHFWSDVYVGGIIGICLATALYKIQEQKWPIDSGRLDRPLFKLK